MSSISAISTNNLYLPQQLGIKQDFQALQKALSSGDITSAQQVFSMFQQDFLTVGQGQASQQTSQTNLQNDLDSVGKALYSGDVAGAQKALSSLRQDLHQIHHGHHHRHQTQGIRSDQSTQNAISPSSDGTASNSTDTGSIVNLIARYPTILLGDNATYNVAGIGDNVDLIA